MSTKIDLDKILAPISKAQPTGIDLREDTSPTSPYFSVKDARNNARNIERSIIQGNSDLDPQKEWRLVLKTSVELLTKKTKDLEIASWVCEALIRQQGFAGLLTGFTMIKGLISNFWDDLYPLPDEDGLESRLAPLIGLNGEEVEGSLIAPIRHVNITQGSSCGPYALWQYQQALQQKADPDGQGSTSPDQITLVDINKAVSESTPEFYQSLQDNVASCRALYKDIDQLLTEKCGADAPPSSFILGALETFADHIGFILNDAPFTVDTAEAEAKTAAAANPSAGAETKPVTSNTTAASANVPGPLTSREQALGLLKDIADYFRKNEPHSPIPFLLERAVRWGKLSLPELLNEMIADDSTRGQVFNLAGIKAESPTS